MSTNTSGSWRSENTPLTDGPLFPAGSPRIHDMPHSERPREKLALLGPAALDNAELMALFISTGTKGRSAIEIGRGLIHKYGSIGALGGLWCRWR
jgi:hypothetical protein